MPLPRETLPSEDTDTFCPDTAARGSGLIAALAGSMTSADARFMAMQAHLLGKTERVQYWRTVAAALQTWEDEGLRTHLPRAEDRFARRRRKEEATTEEGQLPLSPSEPAITPQPAGKEGRLRHVGSFLRSLLPNHALPTQNPSQPCDPQPS
jgi:hypothetical protein